MANDQDIYFRNGELKILKTNPSFKSSFEYKHVDNDVFDYRNRLGLVESGADYASDMSALCELFDKGNSLAALTSTYLTGVGNGSITATISGRALKAIDNYVDAIAGLSTGVYLTMPFAGGTGSAAYYIEIGSAATVASKGTDISYGSIGITLAGSGAINLATAPSALGSSTGGIAVYVKSTTSNVDSTLCGAYGASEGGFMIKYGSASNTLVGTWGGSAVTVTGTTLSAAPASNFIHLHRNDWNTMCLYVDGTRVGSASGSVDVTNGSISMLIGGNLVEATGGEYFTGKIGCAVLTAGSITDAQAATLSNAVSNLMLQLGRK